MKTIVLYCSIFLLPLLLEAEMTIISDGKPNAVIAVGKQASAKEKQAAKVLRNTLARMSGAMLPIMEDAECDSSQTIVSIGRTAFLPEACRKQLKLGEKLIFTDLSKDAFVIHAEKNILAIAGHRDQGTVFAVYGFLESLGCRWFFACDAGTIIPKRKSIIIENIDKYEEPDFAVRWQYTWHGAYRTDNVWKQEEQWSDANKLNFAKSCSALVRGYSGHNFRTVWPAELYGKHPDFFPLLERKKPAYLTTKFPEISAVDGENVMKGKDDDERVDLDLEGEKKDTDKTIKKVRWNPEWGKGGCQRCLSNPGVVKVGLEWARKTFAENPEFVMVTFAPNDGYGHCLCENCKKVGNIADNNLNMANQIGKTLFKEYPDKMIQIWAYAGGAQIPHLKADGYDKNEDRVLVNIMSQFSVTPFDDLLKGWAKASHHICVSNPWYYFHPAWLPSGNPRTHLANIEKYPFFKSCNVKILESQIKGDWGIIGLDRYLAAKKMWDVNADVDKLTGDFCEKMFPSAPDVFLDYIRECRKIKGRVSYKKDLTEFMRNACGCFDAIRKKISTPEEKKRWEFFALFLYAQLLEDNLRQAMRSRDGEKIYQSHYDIVSYLKGTESLGIFEGSQRIPVLHYPALKKYGAPLLAKKMAEKMNSRDNKTDVLNASGDDSQLDVSNLENKGQKNREMEILKGFRNDDRMCNFVPPMEINSKIIESLFAKCLERYAK